MVSRNRVILSGALVGGEEWSVGLTFGGTPEGSIVTEESELIGWAENVKTFLGTTTAIPQLKTVISNDANLSTVTCQYYGISGPLVSQGLATAVNFTGTNPAILPYPTAAVISHQTGRPGASYRGRTYWPVLNVGLDNGRWSGSSFPLLLAQQFGILVRAIQTAAPGEPANGPAVYSRTQDLLTPVRSYRVGDVPDTQRRRRDGLVEVYSAANLPPL